MKACPHLLRPEERAEADRRHSPNALVWAAKGSEPYFEIFKNSIKNITPGLETCMAQWVRAPTALPDTELFVQEHLL